MIESKEYEVIIIGGSYAGMSAAMALGRSLRKVVIIDSGAPCNQLTPHAHNFITQDGSQPSEIGLKAMEEVLQYATVSLIIDAALTGEKVEDGFRITTAYGQELCAKKVIFATGVKDTMPAIKGFADCWGKSVIHCPYCHGYEYKGKRTGIMESGKRAYHLAAMVKNLSPEVKILSNGGADIKKKHAKKLEQQSIEIVETTIAEIEHQAGYLRRVRFVDGSAVELDVVYAGLQFEQHCDIPKMLGCHIDKKGHIEISESQETNIEGVFACGDNSTLLRSIASAVSTGNICGAMVNSQLVQEGF